MSLKIPVEKILFDHNKCSLLPYFATNKAVFGIKGFSKVSSLKIKVLETKLPAISLLSFLSI